MTKKQFKKAMLCGLGRCVAELKGTADKSKYFNEVMWACAHVISWDPQCEGTKSFYIREMINCFDDREPFVSVVVERFEKCLSDRLWRFSHYSALLRQFALDGSRRAEKALWKKYGILYSALSERKRKARGIFEDRDNFETLCIELMFVSEENCFRIIRDIGELYLKNKIYDGWDFSQFDWKTGEVYGKRHVAAELRKRAENDSAFACYLSKREEEKKREESLRRGLQTQAKDKPIENAVKAMDAAELIRSARTDDGETRKKALYRLEKMKGDAVKKFATELYAASEEEEVRTLALCMLVRNYEKEDKDFIIAAVHSVPVCEDYDWHFVLSAVLDLFEKDSFKEPPGELLLWAYENSRCSFCREYVVRAMSRRHMLTRELSKECLYDCNGKIRAFAEKKLKKKEKKKAW